MHADTVVTIAIVVALAVAFAVLVIVDPAGVRPEQRRLARERHAQQ